MLIYSSISPKNGHAITQMQFSTAPYIYSTGNRPPDPIAKGFECPSGRVPALDGRGEANGQADPLMVTFGVIPVHMQRGAPMTCGQLLNQS